MSPAKTSQTLSGILDDTRKEIAQDKKVEPLDELQRRISTAPKVLSFLSALRAPGYGLIAEIKECSPSKGAMAVENIRRAAEAYKNSPCVRAISVLTNRAHFGRGMTLEHLRGVKQLAGKPVLRKEFIVDEYQVYQARAYGADAILLMANILETADLKKFHDLSKSLGMDVLFETHEPEELKKIPEGAAIYGINSRNFCSEKQTFDQSRQERGRQDLTTDLNRFGYCDQLPAGSVKIAESGVGPETCRQVFDSGFSIILVGTALLIGPEPIEDVLGRFEIELARLNGGSRINISA